MEDNIKAFRYTPYTAFTLASRATAAERSNDLVVSEAGGLSVVPRGLDRRDERNISQAEWRVAASANEQYIRKYHGVERGDGFASHHRIAEHIAVSHSWPICVDYDIQQREAVAHDPAHDLATLDTTSLAIITTRHVLAKAAALPGASGPAHSAGPTRRAPATRTAGAPYPARMQQPSAPSGPCFRCGNGGHLPRECTATTTTAGRPVAPLAADSQSPHALAAGDHGMYCYRFARHSHCSYGVKCKNVHSCSVCGDTKHGAASCPQARG